MVIIRISVLFCNHRKYGSEVPWSQTPKMKIDQPLSLSLNSLPEQAFHFAIRHHVEQDRSGVPHEAVRPTRSDAGSDDAGDRVHPEPIE